MIESDLNQATAKSKRKHEAEKYNEKELILEKSYASSFEFMDNILCKYNKTKKPVKP